jgi:hypothetical protein
MSVYSRCIARGRDVMYLKDMSMLIGLDTSGSRPHLSVRVVAQPAPHRSTLDRFVQVRAASRRNRKTVSQTDPTPAWPFTMASS